MEKIVAGIEIEARTVPGEFRIYFTRANESRRYGAGKAIWDVRRAEWVPVKFEFGKAFKFKLQTAYDLGKETKRQ